jgi:hypothetical protein
MERLEVAQFSFEGPRFENHAVPVDGLRELAAFQDLIREIGRWLFQRDNPDRKRVPHHFDQSLALRCRTIEPGSARIPLEAADPPMNDVPMTLPGLTYLERSLLLAVEACNAANEGRSLPREFPRSALAIIDDFGKSLGPDEAFALRIPRGNSCRYTFVTRQAFLTYARDGYEDDVDVVGRVIAADVERHVFVVHADDGSKVVAELSSEHEPQVLTALREHTARRVRLRGRGHFSAGGVPQRVSPVDQLDDLTSENGGERPPIWEVVARIGDEVPPDVLDQVPTDLAGNLDHYLYGAPKRE